MPVVRSPPPPRDAATRSPLPTLTISRRTGLPRTNDDECFPGRDNRPKFEPALINDCHICMTKTPGDSPSGQHDRQRAPEWVDPVSEQEQSKEGQPKSPGGRGGVFSFIIRESI